jgi:hypothetical protein
MKQSKELNPEAKPNQIGFHSLSAMWPRSRLNIGA